MPVHQISVVPSSKETSRRARSLDGDRDEHEVQGSLQAVQTDTQPPVRRPCPRHCSTKSAPHGPANTSLMKRRARPRYRRRQMSGSCAMDQAQADSSSGDEQGGRQARSWSREKARRRRRTRASGHTLKGLHGPGEERPITTTYRERGAGEPDMAAPWAQKNTGQATPNGAPRQEGTDDELEVCRICHCEGDEECPLITPCRCTGSLRFVHHACLHQWIKSSDTHCCELCKFDFIMETHLKPLRKWENLRLSTSEQRKIFCSAIFHLVAMVCVVWSVVTLVNCISEERRRRNNYIGLLDWLFWTKLSMVGASVLGGLVFTCIQGKVYLQLWRRLKAFNRVIFVQNCPDSVRNQAVHPCPEPVGGVMAAPV